MNSGNEKFFDDFISAPKTSKELLLPEESSDEWLTYLNDSLNIEEENASGVNGDDSKKVDIIKEDIAPLDQKDARILWAASIHNFEEATASETSDSTDELLRVLEQFELGCKQTNMSMDCEIQLKRNILNMYGSIVDDLNGLNNYSNDINDVEEVLNPECAKWDSTLVHLTFDELKNKINSEVFTATSEEVCAQKLDFSKEFNIGEDVVLLDDNHICEAISNALNIKTYKLKDKIETMENDINSKEQVNKGNRWGNGGTSKHITEHCEEVNAKKTLKKKYSESDNLFEISKNKKKKDMNGCSNHDFIASKSDEAVETKNFFNSNKSYSKSNYNRLGTSNGLEPYEDENFTREKTTFNSMSAYKSQEAVKKQSQLSFKTAKDFMGVNNNLKEQDVNTNNGNRKCLGNTRRGVSSKFIAPLQNSDSSIDTKAEALKDNDALKNIDQKMAETMLNEIMEQHTNVLWDDIAGLEFVKKTLKEIVVWPMLRPDIFKGLRAPPKGILLFGPPGTGKTLIGKCVASQSKSTFFSISASSLGSKWIGEGEKLVRALFAVARCHQPAVIFIDEIDSLLTQRSESEHESSRKVKTEFLVQLDGVKTSVDERLLIIGATNRPQELDEAARRRLVKRLYIPLPESPARKKIVQTLLKDHNHQLMEEDLDVICEKTNGYSGADMTNLCKEAALGPIRCISLDEIASVTDDQVRPIILDDFCKALQQVRASVSNTDLGLYERWNMTFGSGHSE